MITRIRYFKEIDGSLVSPNMQAMDKVVKVRIVNNTFSIVNASNNEFIMGGRSDTHYKLKMIIKQKLREMGVVFSDEVRKKAGKTTEATTEDQTVV